MLWWHLIVQKIRIIFLLCLQLKLNEITTLNHMYLVQFHKTIVRENQMYKAQYAFNMSMIMCPAVHMATRSLLRSSSTHEPSDPLSRVKFFYISFIHLITTFLCSIKKWLFIIPRRNPLETNNMCVCVLQHEHIAILVPRILVLNTLTPKTREDT